MGASIFGKTPVFMNPITFCTERKCNEKAVIECYVRQMYSIHSFEFTTMVSLTPTVHRLMFICLTRGAEVERAMENHEQILQELKLARS